MHIILKITDTHEVDEQLFKFTKKKLNYTFNPHLLPTFRGILTSIYLHTKKDSCKNYKKYIKKIL